MIWEYHYFWKQPHGQFVKHIMFTCLKDLLVLYIAIFILYFYCWTEIMWCFELVCVQHMRSHHLTNILYIYLLFMHIFVSLAGLSLCLAYKVFGGRDLPIFKLAAFWNLKILVVVY